LFSIFLGSWGLLVMRAAYLQILPNARFEKLERRQFETQISVNSRRGSIFDRDGRELALSTPAYSLYADPSILNGRRAIAKKLSKEFGQSFGLFYSKLKDKKKQFVWLQRQIDLKIYEKIKSWNIHGLAFIEEPKRMYPNGSLLSQTLGIVGSDGRGLEGVEMKYDTSLRGNPKKFTVRKDARGRPLITDAEIFTQSPEGNDLYLTVDRDIQYVLERELSSAMKEHDAESAMGIVLDAKTSAILAIASQPANESRRNRIVSDSIEPGSTMKTFIVAGALRQKLLKPNSKYFCENGSFKIGNRIIR
jgi:cell division protein FtsI (penicillin-binding protein 3)